MKITKLFLCLLGVLALLQVSTTLVRAEGEEAAAPIAAVAAADVAAEAAPEAAEAAADAAIELSGTITSIEAETSTILVEYVSEGAEATSSTAPFKLTEETAITSEEMPLALADLKAGDQVNIIYSLDAEGQKVVQALLVQK